MLEKSMRELYKHPNSSNAWSTSACVESSLIGLAQTSLVEEPRDNLVRNIFETKLAEKVLSAELASPSMSKYYSHLSLSCQ